MYGPAFNLEFQSLSRCRTLHLQQQCRTWLAAQALAHIADFLARHQRVAYAHDDVALFQARFRCRHTLVRFVYHGIVQRHVISDHRSDARVFPAHHHLQVALPVLRIVLRVRVQRTEHSPDGISHHLVGVYRVYIHHVKLLVYSVKDIEVFRHLEIMVFVFALRHCRNSAYYGEQNNYQFLHLLVILFPAKVHYYNYIPPVLYRKNRGIT